LNGRFWEPFSGDELEGDATGGVTLLTTPVPEPSTWAMLLLGFAGLGYSSYRKTRQAAVAAV
jgi:hypothetical protein